MHIWYTTRTMPFDPPNERGLLEGFSPPESAPTLEGEPESLSTPPEASTDEGPISMPEPPPAEAPVPAPEEGTPPVAVEALTPWTEDVKRILLQGALPYYKGLTDEGIKQAFDREADAALAHVNQAISKGEVGEQVLLDILSSWLKPHEASETTPFFEELRKEIVGELLAYLRTTQPLT